MFIFNRGEKTMLCLYEFECTWCLVVTGAGTNFSSVDAKFQLRNIKQIHGFNFVLYQSKIILQPIFILIKLSTLEFILSSSSFFFYFFVCLFVNLCVCGSCGYFWLTRILWQICSSNFILIIFMVIIIVYLLGGKIFLKSTSIWSL